jgi:hypothetical protein
MKTLINPKPPKPMAMAMVAASTTSTPWLLLSASQQQ